MDLLRATEIYEGILASVLGIPLLEAAAQDLLQSAIRYARIRTDWMMATIEDRNAMDTSRTAAHDAFIDACNIVSRNATKQGRTTLWRALLGNDRKEIGDFACYLHAILGIQAR